MNVSYMPLFANPLLRVELDFDLEKLTELIFQIQNEDKKGVQHTNRGGWQSKELPLTKETSPLILNIDKAVQEYGKLLTFKKRLEFSNMWININSHKDSNSVHTHPNCFISGVYYIKTAKKCGDIKFKRSSYIDYHVTGDSVKEYNSLNASYWSFPAIENMLYLFPSWVEHLVTPNYSKEDRISLSFNYHLI